MKPNGPDYFTVRDNAVPDGRPRLRLLELARHLLLWVGLALPLNLGWEIAQLRFYTLWSEGTPLTIAYSILHCTIGDAMIAAVAFSVGAIVARDVCWPSAAPWHGGMAAVSFGLAYTVFSEWFNVYRIESWDYAPSMPLVNGIGLTPLLQWSVVPVVMIALFRRMRRARSGARDFPRIKGSEADRQPQKGGDS